ncbi:MAG: hypothetical protein KBD94_11620, partial [Pyrinomonadaceae bacterium]|nr:hypothetical protein [Pyrinomonadaceae bacterium]
MNSTNSTNSANFHDWLISVSSYMTWDAAHHKHIIDTLERVTTGECKRLMIFMPPRHGKSELVTVRYAAWRLKQKPEMNVIIGSYNQRLANRFSRKIKTVLCDDTQMHNAECTMHNGKSERTVTTSQDKNEQNTSPISNTGRVLDDPPSADSDCALCTVHSAFPFVRPRFKNSEAEWETRTGGGLRAVGVGSGVTGFGANLIIVDDPVKSRAEAESIKYRERVWDWFNDDLYTRLEPNGQIILIQTRWHEDDLAGRLLADENSGEWTVINLPAIAEEFKQEFKQDGQDKQDEMKELPCIEAADHPVYPVHPVNILRRDEIGRTVGDALWPARFNVQHLENTKEKIG